MPYELDKRIVKAKELFSGPFNCAQAVASAYADIIGHDEEEIKRLVSGFGFGMGGERSVCGALSGGIFVLSSTIKDPTNRDELYDRVYYLISQFKKHNDGKLDCFALVGKEPGEKEFNTVCPVLVETVVRLVERAMK